MTWWRRQQQRQPHEPEPVQAKPKQSPKEIARRVAEKVERWEREQAEEQAAEAGEPAQEVSKAVEAKQRVQGRVNQAAGEPAGPAQPTEPAEPIYLSTLPPWDDPPPAKILVPSETWADLLLAGALTADWLLEERTPEGGDRGVVSSGIPLWCIYCGKHGPDMRRGGGPADRGEDGKPGSHGPSCAVGMWLKAMRGVKVETT